MRILNLILCGILLVFSLQSCGQKIKFDSDCSPVDHSSWTTLLREHVDSAGQVSYKDFLQDSVRLNSYLRVLSGCAPAVSWTKEDKLAYWINAYNAFTVKLVVDHYPVASIKNIKKGVPFINSVWDMEFFVIGGQKMTLNKIEHSILRSEFDEPRIHFAIVCASKSCPKLRNEAFTPNQLESQLIEQAIDFINDESKNLIQDEQIQISPIFKWFKKDFTASVSVKEYIAQYAEDEFDPRAKVKYSDYDWRLNGE